MAGSLPPNKLLLETSLLAIFFLACHNLYHLIYGIHLILKPLRSPEDKAGLFSRLPS